MHGTQRFRKISPFCFSLRSHTPFPAILSHPMALQAIPMSPGGWTGAKLFIQFFFCYSFDGLFFFARNDNSFFSSSISHQSIYIYKENLANDVSFDRSLSVSKPFLSHSQLYLTVRVLTESHIFFTLLFHSYERWGDLSACASCCFHVVFVGSECCAHCQFQV